MWVAVVIGNRSCDSCQILFTQGANHTFRFCNSRSTHTSTGYSFDCRLFVFLSILSALHSSLKKVLDMLLLARWRVSFSLFLSRCLMMLPLYRRCISMQQDWCTRQLYSVHVICVLFVYKKSCTSLTRCFIDHCNERFWFPAKDADNSQLLIKAGLSKTIKTAFQPPCKRQLSGGTSQEAFFRLANRTIN